MNPKKTLSDYETEAVPSPDGCLMHPRKAKLARIVYEMRHGPIPEDLEVCHKCDVTMCIRDEHHFLGTHHENMLDAVKKRRMNKSESTRQKLSAAKVGKPGPKHTVASRAAISAGNTGKVRTPEMREHNRKMMAGVSRGPHSEEWRAAISAGHRRPK